MSFDAFGIVEDKIDLNKESDKANLIHSELEHNHSGAPTKLSMITCRKCICEAADAEMKQRVLDIQQKPTWRMKDITDGIEKDFIVTRIVIPRGTLDDALGTQIDWTPI